MDLLLNWAQRLDSNQHTPLQVVALLIEAYPPIFTSYSQIYLLAVPMVGIDDILKASLGGIHNILLYLSTNLLFQRFLSARTYLLNL